MKLKSRRSPHTGYLESKINPHTGEYYLPNVEVRLFGDDEEGAVALDGYLRNAYHEAEVFLTS